MKNKNILIIRTSGNIIDFTKYNCQELGLAKELVKNGHRVTLILAGSKRCKEKLFFENDLFIDIIYLKTIKLNQQLAYFLNIKKTIKSINPDIIQVHDLGIFMTFCSVFIAKINKIKIVLIQGSYNETLKIGKRQLEILFNKTLGNYILNNVDGIGCKTIRAQKYLERYSNRGSLLTPIGLDVNKFNLNKKSSFSINEQLFDDSKKKLLYVGKLEKRRNPLFLVDLIHYLPDDYKLVFVGDGELENDIKMRITQLCLDHRCILLGSINQNEISHIYSKADMLLLPSDYEIYGMVILEAMFHGVPVMSTNNAGAELIIRDQVDGVIKNNLNVKDWEITIKEVFKNNKELLLKYSIESKNNIQLKYVWNKAYIKFEDLYTNVLEQ